MYCEKVDLLGHNISHVAGKQPWVALFLLSGNVNGQKFQFAVGGKLCHCQPKQLQPVIIAKHFKFTIH